MLNKIDNPELNTIPFKHYFNAHAVDAAALNDVLLYMQSDKLQWQFAEKDFYSQYEACFFQKPNLDSCIRKFTNPQFVTEIVELVCKLFLANFLVCTDISAHKLCRGHAIGLHTDAINEDEVYYRVLIHLNKNWSISSNGGTFIMFDEKKECNDNIRFYNPTFGSLLAFEISKNSFHAVSPVLSGERYSIIYTLKKGS